MTMNEEERNARFNAFAKANDAILVKELELDYVEIEKAYRQVWADFAARAENDEYFLHETKRRTVERILFAANAAEQPFEVCHEIWNELLALGFSAPFIKRLTSRSYADTCLTTGHYDAGLEVIEPVIAEFEQSLQGKPQIHRSAEDELASLKLLRDGLLAFRTGDEETVQAWLVREEAEIAARRQRNEEEHAQARSKDKTP